jgi:predicted dehydrogenase
MSSTSPKPVRWGIMATGFIARSLAKDILIDPTTRNTTDVVHLVTGVASSSSKSSAEKFISEMVEGKQSSNTPCTAYSSYEELVKDPNVDIIYVATPHSHHFQNVMLCLTHNKPVLCEKAFTVNAAQAKILYDTAKSKSLFLMEAVWTRYFPLSLAIREAITTNTIGEVLRVSADLSIGANPETAFDPTHRMVNLDLAGGCLLDLGIYALTWVFQTLYHTLPPSERASPKVTGALMTSEPRTGADEMTTMLLEFPKSTPAGKYKAHAIATTAMRVDFDPAKNNTDKSTQTPAVRIQGDAGEIQVFGPIYRPIRFRIIKSGGEVIEKEMDPKDHGGAHGFVYEADEAARCLLAGKLESEGLGWEESTVIMETMDEVRRLGGLKYPERIESTEYPVDLGGKGL